MIDNVISTIAGVVLGSIITGYFTIRATNKAHENQRALSQEIEQRKVLGVLQAIHDEIKTIYERYQETMGVIVEKLGDDRPLLYHYWMTGNYFSLYDGNTPSIGLISDDKLREQIVKTYTLAKGVIDSFQLNNSLVHQFEHWSGRFDDTKGALVYSAMVERYEKQLIEYARYIKKEHHVFKQSAQDLLQSLEKAVSTMKQTTNRE